MASERTIPEMRATAASLAKDIGAIQRQLDRARAEALRGRPLDTTWVARAEMALRRKARYRADLVQELLDRTIRGETEAERFVQAARSILAPDMLHEIMEAARG